MANDENFLTQRLQAVLSEALALPPEQVTPELAFGDLPQWDSMGHMEVMMRLEEQFGIEVNAETITALTSLPAIRAHITALGENNHAGG
jgi:acyl carrier protein